jgi:ABC-type polar amino acid transport system ATPase subunit
MRSFLGKFQIQGNDALKPMMLLSGGQKSRVAFAGKLCSMFPVSLSFKANNLRSSAPQQQQQYE